MKLVIPLSALVGFVLLCNFSSVESAKILVVAMVSTKSHKITYMPLIEELGKRGHEITVLSPVKPAKKMTNVKEIFTIDVEERFAKMNIFQMKESNKHMSPFTMLDEFGEICSSTYDLPVIKELLKEKFDLVFLQPLFNDCALGLIHKINAPLVLFFPTSVPGFLANMMGNYFPPSFVPNIFIGLQSEMNFWQRCLNFGVGLVVEVVLRFYYEPFMTSLYREKLGQDLPPGREILANASLILSNGHFSLSSPKPYLPDIVDVGGLHSRPAKPLPKDLEDFVTKSGQDGFILFSMGSAIRGEQMPEEKRKIFLRVFSKLKQQVLWKWESETMPDLPKNVKLSKWLPQQDVLGHPNIKMFITHCGGGGTEEAIFHGVPMLGLPMLGDQPMNAKNAINLGILVDLEWNSLTEEDLWNGVQEVLHNSTYRENVKRISSIFRDQPNNPLERGVYWVEYVLRHKGAPHLRSPARKLNFILYHCIDVIAAYVIIIFAFIYVVCKVIKLILHCICCRSKKNVSTTSSKKRQ